MPLKLFAISPRPETLLRPGVSIPGVLISCLALIFTGGCSIFGGGAAEGQAPPLPAGIIPVQIEWPDAESIRAHGFYGFNVYRGVDRDGPFVKINPEPIVPSPENPEPEFVVYRDRGLELGETFFYYIETVYQDGRTLKVTPATPKRVTQEMSAEELAAWQKQRDAGRKEAPPASAIRNKPQTKP